MISRSLVAFLLLALATGGAGELIVQAIYIIFQCPEGTQRVGGQLETAATLTQR